MDPETYRPHYHFTPPRNWMNDPNGLVYLGGEYHLFYQYNPYGTAWGHMSWGHAVSPNLVNWEHRPLAIPEEPKQGYTIFSGSAVIDRSNTSCLGRGKHFPMAAIYTADYQARHLEDIHIAFSSDGGRTFVQYDRNPVIAVGESKFGDPKVFWHAETQCWVLAAICGHEQGHAVFYGSPDLRHWSLLSEFHAPSDAPYVWECPDLFPLAVDGNPTQMRWVLKTNWVKPGGGPSGTRYFLGDFDGTTLHNAVPIGQSLTPLDSAIYAEVTYNDAPEDQRILMGWLRQPPHPERPWTGAQAIPRILTLRTMPQGIALCQEPFAALEGLRDTGRVLHPQSMAANQDLPLDHIDVSHRAVELSLAFEAPADSECGLRLDLASGAWAVIGYDATQAELFLAQSDGQRVATPLTLPERVLRLRIFLDQDIVEVFANGTGSLTGYLPFGAEYRTMSLYARGEAVLLLDAATWMLEQAS